MSEGERRHCNQIMEIRRHSALLCSSLPALSSLVGLSQLCYETKVNNLQSNHQSLTHSLAHTLTFPNLHVISVESLQRCVTAQPCIPVSTTSCRNCFLYVILFRPHSPLTNEITVPLQATGGLKSVLTTTGLTFNLTTRTPPPT